MAKKLAVAALDLLEDLLTEILLRLPVKSLLISKSVCKPWLRIISDPSFIKSHLHRALIASRNNPTLLSLEESGPPSVAFPLIRFYFDSGDDFYQFDDYDEDDQQHQRQLQLVNEALADTDAQDLSKSPLHFVRLVKPYIFLYNHRVISSYNGIICLACTGLDNIYLWNPCIRKCKKLPTPPPRTSIAVQSKLGFGYDSISDDYKVVRFLHYHRDNVMMVQVYSANADSWRVFPEPLLNNWGIYKRTNIVVKGVMYIDGGDELVSFDLHREVFRLVPYPIFIQRKRSHVMDFEGSVAMVFEYGPGVDLWTLDEVSGGQMSWSKKFSIHTDLETEIRLSCYLGAGQFFGTKYCEGDYLLYDILYDYKKRETKYYRLGEQNVHANLIYTETLVSLDGFQQLESDRRNDPQACIMIKS